MIKSIIRSKKGVTFLELLVAITLFSVVVLSATEIFQMVATGQRNAIAGQNTQESMRYVFEVIAKEIRTAQKDSTLCTSGSKVFETNSPNNNELRFKNENGDCVRYYLESQRLKIDRGSDSDFITANKIQVSNLKFSVVDDVVSKQSRATILMDIEATGQTISQPIKMQTTVSSRYYE